MSSRRESSSGLFKKTGPVLLTVLLDLLGFGLVIPLLSFFSESHGATFLQVTLLMAVYSIAQFIFAPVWGQISDRYGRRPVILISIAGTALTLAGFAMSKTIASLFLFRTLNGMFAANISTAQAYIADVTPPEKRAQGMGLIGAAFGIGFALGPWVGGELSVYGFAVPIWVAAGLSVVNWIWAWFGLAESRTSEPSPRSKRTINPMALITGLKHPIIGLGILLTFVATFAFAMMESTFALVAEHGWIMDARAVGRLFGWIGIIGIVIQGGLIGRLVSRFGETRLVVVGYLSNVCGLAVLAFATGGWSIGLGCTCLAFGMSLANPCLSSLISRAATADEQGTVLGVNQSLSALARATAPGLGGLLFVHWFYGGAFAAGSLLMLAAVILSGPALKRLQQ